MSANKIRICRVLSSATMVAMLWSLPSIAGGMSGGASVFAGAGAISMTVGPTNRVAVAGTNPSAESSSAGASNVGTAPNAGAPSGASAMPGNGYTGRSQDGVDLTDSPDGGSRPNSVGGGLVWGDPLSTDIVDLGRVHTRLRYFSQIGGSGTQQAVGINFSIKY